MSTIIEFPNDEVWVSGSHLLRRFQDSLYKCLSEQLEPKFGNDWFEKTLVPGLNPSDTIDKDLSGFLSQLIRYKNQNFRLAVSQGYFRQTFLSKEQDAALKSIRRLRNRWYHESSEVQKKIRISDLEELALAIQVFAMDLNLKMECESVLSSAKEGDLSKALFSLSWIARHLENRSIQTNSYRTLQNELAIWKSDYANLVNSSEDYERLNRLTKMLEHAYQALDFQYLFLMHAYHSYQKDLLDMLEEEAQQGLDKKQVLLFEEIKKFQFSSPNNFLTWEEHEMETIDAAFNLLKESQGGDKCGCGYCTEIPMVMSPFTIEDNERNDFLRKILKRENGTMIARLFLSE